MTKCDVDHTGGQKFSTHMDGQPMKSTITMEFLEIKILSQDNYLAISPHTLDFGQIGEESQSILEDMETEEIKIEVTHNGTIVF